VLRPAEITPYLLTHGLISPAQIVDGSYEIVDVSRRNNNFKVLVDSGPSLLIKQGVGTEKAKTVADEARLYDLIRRMPAARGLTALLPVVRLYDRRENLLVLEVNTRAESLYEYHRRRKRCPRTLAAALGTGLGRMHRLTAGSALFPSCRAVFADHQPLAFFLPEPDASVYRFASSSGLELIKIVQGSSMLCDLLQAARAEWRVEALVHGDLRWDHCVAWARPGASRLTRITLVDWELAGMGDPAWDIGTVFSEYLSAWLLSTPVAAEIPLAWATAHAELPLEQMQPAIQAFWSAYQTEMGQTEDGTITGERLVRSVKYAAARLIQTGFERQLLTAHLTNQIVLLMQLSENMLKQPEAAAHQLLGLSDVPEPVR
jgi:hypothetical protein